MSFSEALVLLKEGKRISRRGWVRSHPNSFLQGYWDTCSAVGDHEKYNAFYMLHKEVSWSDEYVLTFDDLFSDDWYVYKDE